LAFAKLNCMLQPCGFANFAKYQKTWKTCPILDEVVRLQEDEIAINSTMDAY